jgi:hypothetical protein
LKLRAAESTARNIEPSAEATELTAAALLATPRCHPDDSKIPRGERDAAIAEGNTGLRTENRELRTAPRPKFTFDALGWHMAERLQQNPLLAGERVDIAFTIGHNDHPEYGGLELSLRDFRTGRV